MWSAPILTNILFIAFVQCSFSDDCKTPLPALNQYINNNCWNAWYLSSSSLKCTDCCVARKITQIGPSRLKAVDFIKKPGEKLVKITRTGDRDPNLVHYRHINGSSILHIVSLDCNKYVVIRLPNNELQYWVRNVNTTQDSVPDLKRCNETLFDYNPNTSCNGVKIV